jgi:hypothetical protein
MKNCMIWARKNDFARWNRESYVLNSDFDGCAFPFASVNNHPYSIRLKPQEANSEQEGKIEFGSKAPQTPQR